MIIHTNMIASEALYRSRVNQRAYIGDLILKKVLCGCISLQLDFVDEIFDETIQCLIDDGYEITYEYDRAVSVSWRNAK